jgi:hypothetical protein
MFNEKLIVTRLREIMKPKFEEIWINRKPSASAWFREKCKILFDDFPILQPEFDLIIKTKTGQLNAIEVKYLNKFNKGYNIPYYVGIGQALALSRFGFDHVGLWLVVDEKVNDEDLMKYGAQAWYFVRNEMSLRMEYSFFKIENNDDSFDFRVIQYTGKNTGTYLRLLSDPEFNITFKYQNAFRDLDDSKKMRKLVEEFLYR